MKDEGLTLNVERVKRVKKVNGQQSTVNGQRTTDNRQRRLKYRRVKKVNRQRTTDNGQQKTDNGQQTLNLIHSRRLILQHPEVTLLATSGRSNCYIATNQKKALFVE